MVGAKLGQHRLPPPTLKAYVLWEAGALEKGSIPLFGFFLTLAHGEKLLHGTAWQ